MRTLPPCSAEAQAWFAGTSEALLLGNMSKGIGAREGCF
jgi:hypothetical protein